MTAVSFSDLTQPLSVSLLGFALQRRAPLCFAHKPSSCPPPGLCPCRSSTSPPPLAPSPSTVQSPRPTSPTACCVPWEHIASAGRACGSPSPALAFGLQKSGSPSCACRGAAVCTEETHLASSCSSFVVCRGRSSSPSIWGAGTKRSPPPARAEMGNQEGVPEWEDPGLLPTGPATRTFCFHFAAHLDPTQDFI